MHLLLERLVSQPEPELAGKGGHAGLHPANALLLLENGSAAGVKESVAAILRKSLFDLPPPLRWGLNE